MAKPKFRIVTSASDCGADEDFVAAHKSTYNGKAIHVRAYCRKKGETLSAKDEADMSGAGKKNGKKTKGWENNPKNIAKKKKTGRW